MFLMMNIVNQKALIRIFHNRFLTTQYFLKIHNTRTQIQRVILYTKAGFKRSYKKNLSQKYIFNPSFLTIHFQ